MALIPAPRLRTCLTIGAVLYAGPTKAISSRCELSVNRTRINSAFLARATGIQGLASWGDALGNGILARGLKGVLFSGPGWLAWEELRSPVMSSCLFQTARDSSTSSSTAASVSLT